MSVIGMETAKVESGISKPHGNEKEEVASLTDLTDFVFKRVLSYSRNSKSIFLEGTFGDKSDSVVLLLEKEPFDEEEVKKLFSAENKQEKLFQNDIYSFFRCLPVSVCNSIKITSVYPATQKHIEKYSYHPIHLINETPELYKTVTLPYLESEQFSLQWVYNILEHKAETERIVLEDTDSDVGFVLLPDLKWDGTTVESLYLLALPFKRGILSLRDLTHKELPLIKNIYEKSLKLIKEKYFIEPSRIQAFFHYQPSFYHLHVHFRFIQGTTLESNMDKCHPVSTVINNLTLMSNYYQLATLQFSVKETDALFKAYESAGLVKRAPVAK